MKFLFLILPIVVGSSLISGRYLTSSKFKEHKEIEHVIKNNVLNACKGEQFNLREITYFAREQRVKFTGKRHDTNQLSNEACGKKLKKKQVTGIANVKNQDRDYDVNENIAAARLTTVLGIKYLHFTML